jgi:3'-phosphoadenosine 5'-phosphosulfate sulfotransferase (PAPS reductase)/FAD synthetase
MARASPKQQRPELWGLYSGRKQPAEGFRVFPLSSRTELDVWQYVQRERLALPSLYFAHEREVSERQGVLMAVTEHLRPPEGTPSAVRRVRFRTVGDASARAPCSPTPATWPPRLPRSASPSAEGGPTTCARRRRWRTASGRSTSDGMWAPSLTPYRRRT